MKMVDWPFACVPAVAYWWHRLPTSGGSIRGMLRGVIAGRKLALLDKFTLTDWLDAVRRHRPLVRRLGFGGTQNDPGCRRAEGGFGQHQGDCRRNRAD